MALSSFTRGLRRIFLNAMALLKPFAGSSRYWEDRYARGGDSGAGSYGDPAWLKAETINAFVARENLQSVIEFGCGDGNQLKLAKYPRYHGFDVSAAAVSRCRERFATDRTKTFDLMGQNRGATAELALSLDVIYHLVEDSVFEPYMHALFGAATRYVLIYSTNANDTPWYKQPHVKHREFSNWIATHLPHWQFVERIPGDSRGGKIGANSLPTDFYIYRPAQTAGSEGRESRLSA